jgi:hypothetical protein
MCNNNSTNRSAKWRNAHRGEYNQYMRDYRNRTISDHLSDSEEIWFETNARKRKLLKQATPSWADHYDIRQIYQKCDELNQRYPTTGFVVHHIIPIAHGSVCGLHVADNLKVVSRSVKKQLGRKFNSR